MSSVLTSWGLPSFAVDDAVLVVSELVTNAVVHAREETVLELELAVGAQWLRVSLADGSAVRPLARTAARHDESGRGITIVAALSDRWGVEDHQGGKRIWFEAARAGGVPLVLRHIPIWQNDVVTGFIDLALERAFVYREHAPSELIEIPTEARAREVEARFAMLETLADYDDQLMEQLLDDIAPPRDAVFGDLVKEMRKGAIVPVLIGAADRGNGIGRLLKAIRHETPHIADTRARLKMSAGGDAVVQVLKTLHTTHGGKLSIVRVLAGSVGDGAELIGPDGPVGRASGVFRIMGQQAAKRDAAHAGETVGLGKLDGAKTGMTLGGGKNPPAQVVALSAPDPVLGTAVASAERKDDVKLSAGAHQGARGRPLASRHPCPGHRRDADGRAGRDAPPRGVERLTGKYGIAVKTQEPAIPYKETIRGATSVRGRHKKQSGGHGQFGDVVLEIKPLPRGSGFQFTDEITGGVVPRNYIPSVEEGVTEYLAKGPLGFPVVDVSVTLTDGSYHSVDSSDMAFRTAAQIGMREGMPQCRPVLLEPVLKVEIAVPSEATARVNGIVSQRRGQLLGFDARPGWKGWDVVEALIPQAEIRDLIVDLRSATAGVGTFKGQLRSPRRTDRQARGSGDREGRRQGGVRSAAPPLCLGPHHCSTLIRAGRRSF